MSLRKVSTAKVVCTWIGVLVLAWPLTPAKGQEVLPGVDVFRTIEGPGSYEDFSGAPLPADFFGPGSDPFDGRVYLRGQPLDPPLPDYDCGAADTIVRRPSASTFGGGGGGGGAVYSEIPTEIISMNLVSCEPITVTYAGVPDSFFDVYVTLNPTPPSVGQLVLQKDDPAAPGGLILPHYDGGEFAVDSFFDITYQIEFVPLVPGPTLTIALGAELMLQADTPWAHEAPCGAWIVPGSPPDCTSNFFPGGFPPDPCIPPEPLQWESETLHLEWLLTGDYPPFAGDLNNDDFVGGTDLDIVLGDWGNSGANIVDPRADVNGDDFVGGIDLDYVLGDWGKGCPPPVPGSAGEIPEPTTMAIAVIAATTLLRRRRRA